MSDHHHEGHQTVQIAAASAATAAAAAAARLEEQEQQEKTKVRVRQFMNILEQLPRLCSPTICGTLSQPTTRAELSSRGADMFEWSLEQKAILSPANITTDTEDTDEWQSNVADLNPSWRQLESERFFSQRTIAPSPHTPMRTVRGPKYQMANVKDLILDEEDEEAAAFDANQPQDLRTNINSNNNNINNQHQHYQDQPLQDTSDNQSHKLMSYTELDDDSNFEYKQGCDEEEEEEEYRARQDEGEEEEEADQDNHHQQEEEDQDMDNLFFSPQPLASSQSQQRMDVFSPNTFVHCMEDDNTLQSTPKTTGSISRTRRRSELLD